MEFNEKLSELRKNRNLTQEQLAEALFVSRAAISKWESGKGYPNIESLKMISKYFEISIDELLSGEELITLAETENKSSIQDIYNFLMGMVDLLGVLFIILPLYANPIDGYYYSVNLLSYSMVTIYIRIVYWSLFLITIGIGIVKLLLLYFHNELGGKIVQKSSIGLNIITMFVLIAAREPYAATLSFVIFLMKVILLLKLVKVK